MSALDYADRHGLAAVSAAIRARGGLTGAVAKVALAKGKELLAACRPGVLWGKDAALALKLISEGADLNCVDESGRSPLIWASMHEKLDEVAARLIASGAKLDVVDKDGRSALTQACTHKRVTTALVLVDRGAALNFVDSDGKSALDWACEKCSGAVPAAIRARGGRTAAEIRADR